MNSLSELVAHTRAQFVAAYGQQADLVAYAPGRINLIGEHTDYNQGLSLPSGINRWVAAAFRLRPDDRVIIRTGNFEGLLDFRGNEHPELDQSWKKYVFGAVSIFSEHTPRTTGFEAMILGNVPIGSGVSSSAAIEVSVMNGLRALYKGNWTDLELVLGCQQVEHRFLNLKSGMLDQYASEFSREGHVLLLDFLSQTHETMPAEISGWKWVVVDTQVKRELAGATGYRERVQEMAEALEQIQAKDHNVRHFRDVTTDHLAGLSDEKLRKRVRHVITENERVVQMADALHRGDAVAMGKLLNASHQSLRDDYAVSCEEADFLTATAQNLPGCAGARMMGGGFGGATLHLVAESHLDDFAAHVCEAYHKQFGITTFASAFELVGGAAVWQD
jgi:galactokinase